MAKRPSGHLRIIGGEWRRRIVRFDPASGLRPTPDRVRETLFNWLAARIEGARCLDLFAGSGALGIEALSRGAAQVVFVDLSPKVQDAIRRMLRELGGEARAQFYCGAARDYLVRGAERFDLVFLDPPFRQNLILPLLDVLPPHLAPRHRVYVEMQVTPKLDLPEGWQRLKTGKAGQVAFGLYAFAGTDAAARA